MKCLNLLLVLLLAAAVSCSNSRKTTTDSESSTTSEEVSEIVEETSEEEADFIVDGDDEELIVEDVSDDELIVDDIILEETSEPIVEDIELTDIEVSDEELATEAAISSSNIEISNDIGTYTVKSGETLMMIAFNIYGDYRKWRELRDMNGLSSTNLRVGSTIQYRKPAQVFTWSPDGLPYLIRRGDTLGTISNDKYGTYSKWRLIYDNNRPLIQDPNLIFAGFTIYYIPEGDLASYTGAN